MKQHVLILATILAGCVGTQELIPLKHQESFKIGDNEYMVFVSSNPEEPRGGQPFILDIRLQNAVGREAVEHLTYDVLIERDGKTVFADSRHAMEGAPYGATIHLGAGDYKFRLVISSGMGDKMMKLYETQLKFTVKGG